MKLLLLVLLAIAAMPAAAALKVFATVPEWGALAREIGGRPGAGVHRHHGNAGSASRRRATLTDRAGAQRRSADRHRRRSGGRLAAGGAARIRQSAHPVRPARILRSGAACAMLECRRVSIAPTATCMPRQSAYPDRSAQRPEGRRGARAAHEAQLDPANAAAIDSGWRAFSRALANADQALGKRGGAAQGRGGHHPAQVLDLSVRLAGHARGGHAGAQARCRTLAGASRPSAPAGGEQSPAHGDPRRLQLGATRGVDVAKEAKVPIVVLPFTIGAPEAKDLDGAVRRHGAAAAGLGDMNLAGDSTRPAGGTFRRPDWWYSPPTCRWAWTVLRRGIIFIDLAMAQVAALGVIVAGLAHLDEWWGGMRLTQLAAASRPCGRAVLLTFCERRWPDIQEALIGLLFVFAAAAAILLLAGNPHGGEHLRDLLAGQILWTGTGARHAPRVAALSLSWPGCGSRVAALAKARLLRCCLPSR
jgi:hypothetical protein